MNKKPIKTQKYVVSLSLQKTHLKQKNNNGKNFDVNYLQRLCYQFDIDTNGDRSRNGNIGELHLFDEIRSF